MRAGGDMGRRSGEVPAFASPGGRRRNFGHTEPLFADNDYIMAFIDWTADYELGILEIDRQHRRLVEIVNRLHDAMEQDCPRGVVQGVVSDLVTYTELHFTYEEMLMRRMDYPGLESHLNEHSGLTRELMESESALKSGQSRVSVELMSFLRKWLLDHVIGEDRALANYAVGGPGVGVLVLCSQRF